MYLVGRCLYLSFTVFAASLLRTSSQGEIPKCDRGLFRCGMELGPGKWCISQAWVCDGEMDCPDGLDEQQNCTTPTCAPDKFACKDNKLCIPKGWLCDEEDDCIDGSDETAAVCRELEFQCPSHQYQCDAVKLCLEHRQLCDGVPDCPDSTDEGMQCRTKCRFGNKCPDDTSCRGTHDDTVCVCTQPGFYFNESQAKCKDLNECEHDGYCDQMCTNSNGSYSCGCAPGYKLQADMKTCETINEPAEAPVYLLYNNATQIYKALLQRVNSSSQNSLTTFNVSSPTLVINTTRAKALDYDFESKTICFVTDNVHGSATMQCVSLTNSSSYNMTVAYDMSGVGQVARDWVSKTWYFTDEDHERIFVCNDGGTVCVTLMTTQLKGPKAIVVDPLQGYMFFTTLLETPKIERASLAGDKRFILVPIKKIVRPQGLTLDYVNQHVYWSDSYLDRIERVDYDGSNRKLIIKRLWVENVFGLALFENFLYATSQRNNTLVRVHRLDDHKTPREVLIQDLGNPMSVKVVHRQQQPLAPKNPCSLLGCQDLCVIDYTEQHETIGKCLCRAGQKPDPSNHTKCIAALGEDEHRFLLYANAKLGEIKGISLDPNNPYEVMPPIAGLERPVAVDYHRETQYIYYSDSSRFRIGRRKVNDVKERDDEFITQQINNPEGIAIDWMGHNIYWTDEGLKKISVAKLSNTTIRKTLIYKNISHPRAIVVDPKNGYMYWTDWVQRPSSTNSAIMTANMDGSDHKVLIQTNIQWPNGLSLDVAYNILYWCDAYMDRIESYDLGTLKRKLILSAGGNLKHPFGITHDYPPDGGLVFYWTEFVDGQIKRFVNGTNPPHNATVQRNDSVPLFEILLFNNKSQVGTNKCSPGNGNICSHLCLARPNDTRTCACPDGMNLTADNVTCELLSNFTASDDCPDEFKCKNGRCLNKRWLCDGDNDCGDNSDEDNSENGACHSHHCLHPELMHRCSNNRCIYLRWMCDGQDDCRNGEDEDINTCNKNNCTGNMTRCPQSKRCIPESWICDHDNDCGDGWDERNCTYEQCRLDQFTCDNKKCISREYVCDGDNDCRDKSDERGCTCNNNTQFLCHKTLHCIDKIYQCDGENNCGEGDDSDEQNCEGITSHCFPASQFTCGSGFCIHINLQCDGSDDCGDNSDELNCTRNMTCAEDAYKCPGEAKCIARHWLCDGDTDCLDESDEVINGCVSTPKPVECEYPSRYCKNDSSKCITIDQLCDGNNDCADKSDEGGNCTMWHLHCANAACSDLCSKAPEGFACHCPPQKKVSMDNRTCVDAFPCQKWGVCSQTCENYMDRPICNCFDGFMIEDDHFTCKPIDGVNTYIIFSNRHEIRRLDVEGRTYVSLVSGLRNTVALDYYYNKTGSGDGSFVFWTDVVDDKIYKATLISNTLTNINAIINIGLATTEGLAVDWIAHHIYWVESNLDQIEVANFDGSHRATLVAGNMNSPRAIVVDPRQGMMFWSDWDSNRPRIESASMSGQGRAVIFNVSIIDEAGWPNGLTADYDAKRLYWIDARSDSIHTIDYMGKDPREILRGHPFMSHPFAITVFGNYMYWTDWRTNSLNQASKWNGTGARVIQMTIAQPFDLHVFHPRRQPDAHNPCAVNNGGCSQNALCLLSFNTSECRCPHLMRLKEDKKTCELDGNFLLFAKKEEIRGVDLDNAHFNVIPALTTPHVYDPMAMDYDIKEQKIYWADGDVSYGHHGIKRAFLNGTKFETIIDTDVVKARGFAIDWISRNMYFSAAMDQGTISVATLDGGFRTVLLQTGMEHVNINIPTSIAVHPVKGLLFWADINPEKQDTINVANLNGSNPRQLFPADGVDIEVASPSSLIIDYDEEKLWWVNQKAEQDFVVYCNLDGSNPEVFNLVNSDGNLTDYPTAIAVHKNLVFFAGSSSKTVNVMNKNGTDIMVLRSQTPLVTALKVFITDRLPGETNACARPGGEDSCNQLCLPLENGERVCRCTAGFKLGSDNKTCEGVKQFLMFSNKTQILGIPLDPSDMHTQALAPISGISMVTAIDFHAENDHIYWVDTADRTISRIKRDLTEKEAIVKKGIIGVEGIAIDWMAGNLYWVDQTREVIEVSWLNGSNNFVVHAGEMEKPRSIVVHPQMGYMYWSDASSSKPRIQRAHLDGSSPEVFLNSSDTQMKKPYALTIDYDENVMYWCDLGLDKIERVDLASKETQVLVNSENVTDCMGISVSGDYIYWTDVTYRQGALMRAKKADGTDLQVLREEIGGNVRDVKVFEASRQKGKNLCSQNNGGCQELCFYIGDGKRNCQCAHGRLVEETKCTDYTQFLAYSKVTGIQTVHMFDELNPNDPRPAIEIPENMKNVIGLSFDKKNERYFFTDIQRGDIQTVRFNGTDPKLVVDKVGSAEGLAYDSAYRELYWTSYTNSSISRIKVDENGAKIGAKVEKIVQLKREDHPRAIVIDSCDSRIYWTNWNDNRGSIQRAFISGWPIENIITTDIRTPNGLTIDHAAQKLYWSDARLDKIERCDYDGKNRVVIVQGHPQHAFGLAVYGNFLYWTDWILHGIMRANKFTGREVTRLKMNIARQPMAIIAVADDTEDCLKNKCLFEKGGCSQICKTDAAGNPSCSCFDNFELLSDNKTCQALCGVNEFVCKGGGCIAYDLICDGRKHCPDNSDEDPTHCRTRMCPPDYFSCFNGRCVPMSKHCDGSNDCSDNSDEYYCSCPDDQFHCKSGSCIKGRYKCDHDKDCPDASDEMDCAETDCSLHFGNSDSSEFIKCNFTTACILPSWRCDGQNDCWDNSDEEECDNVPTQEPKCPLGWFQCVKTKTCIPDHWQCDGGNDCGDEDKSDEEGCLFTCAKDEFQCDKTLCKPGTWRCDGTVDCSDETDEEGCDKTFTCPEDDFLCNSTGKCIPKQWVCDGEKDCADGQDEVAGAGCVPERCDDDEFQCGNYRCVWKAFYCDGDDDCGDMSDEPTTCEYQKCGPDEFKCKNATMCLPKSQECDGIYDCPDKSDEDKHCKAEENCGFQCRNGVCIDAELVCNVNDDCGDSSDELYCSNSTCGRCHHNCDLKSRYYKCSCHSGYKLANDSATCEDIDECAAYSCSQFCFNTVSSFHCHCAEGFRLTEDKRTCKVDDSSAKPVLLITNRYYIRNITMDGQKMDLIANNLTNAVALDFHYDEGKIYWSDVTSSSSKIQRMDLNGSNIEELHRSTLRNPDGIAVDWWGGNLYWCDKTTDTIEVSKLNGLYRRVLIKTGLQEPRGLAVHPFRGFLYYTDWGDNAHIGRLGMDGTQQKQLITDNLRWPNALTIDYYTDTIFWADARLDYIAMANWKGEGLRTIIHSKTTLPHIFALTVFEDHLYWTDWENKAVERAHKFHGEGQLPLRKLIHRPMDIQVYHSKRQPQFIKRSQVNPCKNSGCGEGTLCLIKPGGLQHICACPEHHHLSQDKTTCIAECTSSEFLCNSTYKCIPFWWRCDEQDDCGDKSDEPHDCPVYHCQQPGLFQCEGASSFYHCISPTQICDGHAQCTNKSDEKNCDTHTCLESQFKCQNPPKCIPKSQRCNGHYDCEDKSDEKQCPSYTCAQNQFQCINKRCIPYVWKCDNDNDCGDNSDEPADCKTTLCPEGYMKCNNSGRCIPESWKCDGDHDCGSSDVSDEPDNECDSVTCDPSYFKCNNSRCIPGRWQCDYDDDCRDGSDEVNCQPRNCSESEFRCNNSRCIKKVFHCDGQTQCEDGSDEDGCGLPKVCKEDQFKCERSNFCIPSAWVCDGDRDCVDMSDELTQECHNKTQCSNHEFHCKSSSQCISRTWLCDGQKDCFDGSDEMQDMCSDHLCAPGYYKCDNNKCFPTSRICDGTLHCKDGSDEHACGPQKCAADEFRCTKTGQCIPAANLCDNYLDCSDSSDEGSICGLDKCNSNAMCSSSGFECKNFTSEGRCVCKANYKLTDVLTCQAVNQCEQFGTCEQYCSKQSPDDANFLCYCGPGYVVFFSNLAGKNTTKCKAAGNNPYLLIGAGNKLYTYDINPKGLFNMIDKRDEDVNFKTNGMDVHVAERTAFITNLFQGPSIFKVEIPDSVENASIAHVRSRRKRQTNEPGDDDTPVMQDLQIAGLEEPRGIAVDWISQRIYWADSKKATIEMSEMDGSKRKTLIARDLHKPHAILVNPIKFHLYWSDVGPAAKIETSLLDGTNRSTLVSKQIYRPVGLALDYPNNRLYWADAKLRVIESVTLDGHNRHLIWDFSGANGENEEPNSLSVFEDWLYVSTASHKVFKMKKFGPPKDQADKSHLHKDVLATGLQWIGDIAIVHPAMQSVQQSHSSNPCNKSNPCDIEALCINTQKGAQCLCPDGGWLNKENHCVNKSSSNECNGYCHNHGSCWKTEKGQLKCSCNSRYVGDRCQLDLCYGHCLNGGMCSTKQKKAVCECTYEYTGDRCEHYRCTGFCKNRGLCMLDPQTKKPRCKCPIDYTGEKCEQNKTERCENYPCENGGSCQLSDKKQQPSCKCPDRYTGTRCHECVMSCNGSDCQSLDCGNEGICHFMEDTMRTPKCDCTIGYKAVTTCDEHHPKICHQHCVSHCKDYCYFNGTCKVDNGIPNCTCHEEYDGNRCQRKKCDDFCKNNGICSVANGVAKCKCPAGFLGDKCQDKSKCSCQNGGTCIPNANEASPVMACKCPLGYVGPTCGSFVGCSHQPICHNRGTCHMTGRTVECFCPPGWSGERCETKIPEECVLYCKNGGRCDICSQLGTVPMCEKCRCQVGYGGRRCEKYIEEYSQDMKSATAIVVPIIVVCLIILIVILAIYVYRKRANRQFKHMRMAEPGAGNVEITNPMYLRDYDDEEGGDVGEAFTFDPDKPTNFSNPMYDTLYNENAAELMSPDNEKNQLLKEDKTKVQFFGDEERQPLGSSKA